MCSQSAIDCVNTGTDEERGLAYWKSIRSADTHKWSVYLQQQLSRTYDLPCGMSSLRQSRIARHIPFLPTFGQAPVECCVSENLADS